MTETERRNDDQFKSGTVEVGEEEKSQIYYEQSIGNGPNTIVLVHGNTLDRRIWDEQVQPFVQNGLTVVRYDMHGFGKSGQESRSGTNSTDLEAVLNDLGVEKAVLVGHSLGVRAVTHFAQTFPERTDALITVGAAAGGSFSQNLGTAANYFRRDNKTRAVEEWLRSSLFTVAMKDPDVAAKLRTIVSEYSGYHWLNGLGGLTGGSYKRKPSGMAQEYPILHIIGQHEEEPFHRNQERLIGPGSSHAEGFAIFDTDHMPFMEKPDVFNEAVLQFLTRQGLI
jgi:pimeloyl-ACP methyl ester carboxylesterase